MWLVIRCTFRMNCLALPLSCGPQNLSMFPEQDCAPWLVWKAENVSYPACLIFPDFAEAWQLIHPLVSCLISDFSSCFCCVMFVQETGDLYFPSSSLHETRSKISAFILFKQLMYSEISENIFDADNLSRRPLYIPFQSRFVLTISNEIQRFCANIK